MNRGSLALRPCRPHSWQVRDPSPLEPKLVSNKTLVVATLVTLGFLAALWREGGGGAADENRISSGEIVRISDHLSAEGFTLIYFGAEW